MRPLPTALALTLALASGVLAPPARADDLSCRLTRACIQGGPCLRADVPLAVVGADGPRPVLSVDGATEVVDRDRNFYGTVFNGWNNARRPASRSGELWLRPNGRATYVRRADVRGVTIRTDYTGRCVQVRADPGAVVVK